RAQLSAGSTRFGLPTAITTGVRLQDQPVPDSPVIVSPGGAVSVTTTCPSVGPPTVEFGPTTLRTVRAYVSAASPWLKLPVCDRVVLRSADCWIAVDAATEIGATSSPPPETVTDWLWGVVAFGATDTTSVIAGSCAAYPHASVR